jgi:hypothetical protein
VALPPPRASLDRSASWSGFAAEIFPFADTLVHLFTLESSQPPKPSVAAQRHSSPFQARRCTPAIARFLNEPCLSHWFLKRTPPANDRSSYSPPSPARASVQLQTACVHPAVSSVTVDVYISLLTVPLEATCRRGFIWR